MANRKKEVYKPKPMTEGKRNVIQGLLREYDIQTAEDIQDALKDLLSGTLKEMLEMDIPQDRQNSFEPQLLPKHRKDISAIDDKIISMYAKGMTVRQISETIEDI